MHDYARVICANNGVTIVFNFFGLTVGLVILVLGAFGVLNWLQIPAGNLLDWVIGGASFWWLLAIVTVPWNIFFQAKEVLAEAELSAEKGMQIDDKQTRYAQSIAQRSLLIAIALHLASAIGLYWLAAADISKIGYISSGAALMLTALRPAVRTYQYLATRLAMIRQEFTYPRDDVYELRQRFTEMEHKVQQLRDKLDEENPTSWVTAQERQWEATQTQLTQLATGVEEFRINNQADHNRLSREAQQAINQLSADSQFLDQVREIIRFFKSA